MIKLICLTFTLVFLNACGSNPLRDDNPPAPAICEPVTINASERIIETVSNERSIEDWFEMREHLLSSSEKSSLVNASLNSTDQLNPYENDLGDFNHLKVFFACAAVRAKPVFRNFLPFSTRSNAVFWPALCLIINKATNHTNKTLHGIACKHKKG